MKKGKWIISALFCIAILAANFQTTKSNKINPPAGRDGDPNTLPTAGLTCRDCHAGAAHNATGNVVITVDDGTNSVSLDSFAYLSNTAYTITYHPTVTANRYGFQLSVLSGHNKNAGTLALLNANTSLTSNGRASYVGHKNASTTNTWQFKWTSPSIDSGDITFYYAFNAANASDDETGDAIYNSSTVVHAGVDTTVNAVSEVGGMAQFSVYPNPVKDVMMIGFNNPVQNAAVKIEVYNQQGSRVLANQLNAAAGYVSQSVDVSNLAAGVYLLSVTAGQSHSVSKIVVE